MALGISLNTWVLRPLRSRISTQVLRCCTELLPEAPARCASALRASAVRRRVLSQPRSSHLCTSRMVPNPKGPEYPNTVDAGLLC